MTTSPAVSVCIANYNGMDVIDDCLRSVLAQVGGLPVEIIVHDDASTDGSVAHLRAHYPQIRLICSESNVGFCIANNRMAAAAQGDYLLLLNNDAALFKDALHSLLAEAQAIALPAILSLPQYDARSGALVDKGCLLDPFYNPVPNLDPERKDVAMVIGACLWIPRSLWLELEGFPEWFGSIAEDMYLCCRARLAGYAVRALTESGYRHWQGKSFGGNRLSGHTLKTTFRRRALSERNKTFVMAMTLPWFVFWFGLPLHLLLLQLEGLALSALKRNPRFLREVYLPVLGAMFSQRRHWLAGRRAMQTRRNGHAVACVSVMTWWPHKLVMWRRHGLPKVN